jgi:hypothetical protein
MRGELFTACPTRGGEMSCDLSLHCPTCLPNLPAADVWPKQNPVTAPTSPIGGAVTTASAAQNALVSTVSGTKASLARHASMVTKPATTTTASTTSSIGGSTGGCRERVELRCRIIAHLDNLACARRRGRRACCHRLGQFLHFSHRYPRDRCGQATFVNVLSLFVDDLHCHARQGWQSASACGEFDRSVEQFPGQGGGDWNVANLTIGCSREDVK